MRSKSPLHGRTAQLPGLDFTFILHLRSRSLNQVILIPLFNVRIGPLCFCRRRVHKADIAPRPHIPISCEQTAEFVHPANQCYLQQYPTGRVVFGVTPVGLPARLGAPPAVRHSSVVVCCSPPAFLYRR